MTDKKPPIEIQILLDALDDAYHKPGWHGPSLRSTIRRVSAKEAASRVKNASHSVAELVLHCAYWKYAGLRRLTGAKRGGFPLKGSNWFSVPADLSESDWKLHVKLLDDMHAQLRETIAALPKKRLTEIPSGAKVTNLKLIYGLAAHDAYHAGQIRTLRGLLP
ncbi:MAG: DinB family protein [Phycisphaerales bacterium]|nr:DinB family protein [Phycisphaerales bacterium]MCB9862306.1 DinB family protein [Phycisphaerales bacterium]